MRLIEFPKKFRETLATLPRVTARGVMTTLGRLAAGEPSAFVGLVQLKACTEILRVRIGIDYRLLFRLHADRVQVIDLINRKDLDRRIKQLRAAGYAPFRLASGDGQCTFAKEYLPDVRRVIGPIETKLKGFQERIRVYKVPPGGTAQSELMDRLEISPEIFE